MRDFFVLHSTRSHTERVGFHEKLNEAILFHNQCHISCRRDQCRLVSVGCAIIARVCKEFYYDNYRIFHEAGFKFQLEEA